MDRGPELRADRYVRFECVIRAGKAAAGRLGVALVEHDGHLLSGYRMGSMEGADYVALLAFPLEEWEAARDAIRPEDWRYRSPTWFANGSLRPWFKTPDEEVGMRRVCMALGRFAQRLRWQREGRPYA